MPVDDAVTLSQPALEWLADLAEDARQNLRQLPESSQPLWFRSQHLQETRSAWNS